MNVFWIGMLWVAGLVTFYQVAVRLSSRQRAVERLTQSPEETVAPLPGTDIRTLGFLQRWLSLAGYRSQLAGPIFIGWAIFATLAGLIVAYALTSTGILLQVEAGVRGTPGGLGNVFLPVITLAPWLTFLLLATAPIVVVRGRRRRRVEDIENDLPMTLELLATLGQAGLAFDSSIDKLLDSQNRNTPLNMELRMFQLELLAGVSRVQAFRRLADRIRVSTVSMFVSALVQAEQLGTGLASVLRQQADDLRNRRRERSLLLAQSLPVKLVFPLVICFLPGIFVGTLGPAFHQFFQMADTMISGGK
ncbi:MAG: type II secretion system F family protein [Planctomycetota bacterium]